MVRDGLEDDGGKRVMLKKGYQLIIIGGGASGMAAAIAALQEMQIFEEEKNRGRVLLLESNDRVGKKILATGNGKCNFTHENISVEHYHTDDRAVLESVLKGFPTEAALAFFEGLGMLSREKNGYFYPLSETASTVLDVLRLRLEELSCETLCGVLVERIEKREKGFLVCFQEAEKRYGILADNVILATGSKAGGFLQDKSENPLRLAEALGLRSTPLYPALTKCVCREAHYYKQLAGVRAQAVLSLYAERQAENKRKNCPEIKAQCQTVERHIKKAERVKHKWELLRQESGELQLTKEGISGIAVFQLSGEIAQKLAEKKRVMVEINFLPDFCEDTLDEWIEKRLSLLPGRSLEDFFLGVLHKKILGVCLQAEGLRESMRVPCAGDDVAAEKNVKKSGAKSERAGKSGGSFAESGKYLSADRRAFIMIFSVMKRAMHFATEVTAVSDMRQAQVCRGGLYLSQFDEKLECKEIPGLFACGELLNVDGECGGYNLHFAWASGNLAGQAAVRRVEKGI